MGEFGVLHSILVLLSPRHPWHVSRQKWINGDAICGAVENMVYYTA